MAPPIRVVAEHVAERARGDADPASAAPLALAVGLRASRTSPMQALRHE